MYCVVFDLDGTLADTSADLLAAANRRFEELGYEPPLTHEDRHVAHAGGRAMLSEGATRLGLENIEDFADEGYPSLIEHYRNALAVNTQLYDHAMNVINALQEDGWLLAVCTNKPVDLAEPLLAQLGVRPFMRAVIGVNSMPERKPDPKPLLESIRLAGGSPERAVLIGDSATDYNAAKNAGVQILLVDFDDTNIGETFPDAPLVRDFIALENWLQNWRDADG